MRRSVIARCSPGLTRRIETWLADALVVIGRMDEARALFDRLVGLTNDLGLLAEEYDPVAKRMLGNFPQALSHVASSTRP